MATPPEIRSDEKGTKALLAALGTSKILLEGQAKFMASFDSSKLSFDYAALIRAETDEDVGTTLRLANEHSIPVTTRGAGTSLTGSASPIKGGWVLDLSQMNEIGIRKEKGMAVVQSGAVVADIQAAAEAEGLFYPPDPSSLKYCTIGGNIACNAGGMRCAKYGVTRDFVVALEGYLPTGEKVSWGGEYRKFAVGYNVRDLWIGSEGTLGVVTRAVLKLVPLPETTGTLVAAFESEELALQAVRSLLAQGVVPSILEYLDTKSVYCAEEIAGVKLFQDVARKPIVLVEVDGSEAEVQGQMTLLAQWADDLALACRQAADRSEAEELWEARRKCSGAMFALGNAKINEDIVVPLESQIEFSRFIGELQQKWELPMPTFGHAADGNFHVNIMFHREIGAERDRAEGAVEELMRRVVELGGTISGEHGIGLAKTPFLRIARNAAEIGAMLAIKRALDPCGILNPGKLFDVFEVWTKTPVDVRLPWDKKPIQADASS